MKHTLVVTPAGEELVMLAKRDFDALCDAADAADARAVQAALERGESETLSVDEVKAALAAPTPLAFWRAKRGKKQKDLAAAAGVSPSYVADLEAGRRKGDPVLFKRLARALAVRMEDLVADDGAAT
jgi:predicted transcriptional regulator